MADVFVAGVAISLGCCGLSAAATSADWPLRWSLAAWLRRKAGQSAMRFGYLICGLGLIAIGISIVLN